VLVRADATNSDRPRWVTLIMAYFLIVGAAGTVRAVVNMLFGPVSAFPFGDDFLVGYAYGGRLWWAWPAFERWSSWSPLLVFGCGLSLWRRPARVRHVVVLVAVVLLFELAFFGLNELYQAVYWRFAWKERTAQAVVVVARCIVPLGFVWLVRRRSILRNPERVLLAWCLVVIGSLGIVRCALKANYDIIEIVEVTPFVAQQLGGWSLALLNAFASLSEWFILLCDVVVIACGVFVARYPAGRRVSRLLLAGGLALLALPAVDVIAYYSIYGSGVAVVLLLRTMATVLPDAAVVVAIGVFLWRCPLADGAPHRACAQCGYNLTGNVTGICPECGVAIFARPPTR
jgi:hypothetical protein